MNGRMRTWIPFAAAVLATAIGAVLVLAAPAGATGDPTLDRAIAITPPAGWVLAPSSVSEAQANQAEQVISPADQFQFKVATKEWTQPNSTNQLTVTLWAYAATEISEIRSRVGAEKVTCAQGQIAVTGSVSGVAGSKETSCSTPPPNGANPGAVPTTYDFTTVGWFDGDTYATVHAIGLPSAQVTTYAREVAAAIPTGGIPAGSGSSTSDLLLVGVGGVAIVVAVAAVVVVMVRRRRPTGPDVPAGYYQPFPSTADSRSPATANGYAAGAGGPAVGITRQPTEAMPPLPAFRPSPPAVATGWHPMPGDPTKTAYWDGTQWAAYRQWDGHQWLDAAALHR